jgi:hypothetical protein
MALDKRVEAFLKELTELSEKHNIVINGCGECGSPWLAQLRDGKEEDVIEEHLSWDDYYYSYRDGKNVPIKGYSTRDRRLALRG